MTGSPQGPGFSDPGFDRSRLDAIRDQLANPRPAASPAQAPRRAPSPTPQPKVKSPARAADERPQWQVAAAIIGGFALLLYVIEFIDALMDHRLDQWGIEPLTLNGLWGILFAPLLHANWEHLAANTLPLLVLGFLVLLSGIARGLAATGIIWVVAGVGVWFTGGQNTLHIGASGIVFGWLAYLLVRGFFTRKIVQMLIGIVVFLIYGSLLWGALPGTPGVSWQGHLFGAIGGVLAAWILSGPERDARRARSQASASAT